MTSAWFLSQYVNSWAIRNLHHNFTMRTLCRHNFDYPIANLNLRFMLCEWASIFSMLLFFWVFIMKQSHCWVSRREHIKIVVKSKTAVPQSWCPALLWVNVLNYSQGRKCTEQVVCIRHRGASPTARGRANADEHLLWVASLPPCWWQWQWRDACTPYPACTLMTRESGVLAPYEYPMSWN